MRAFRSWLGLLGTLALAGLPVPAGSQPVGSEFQVNTHTTSDQTLERRGGRLVAADATGDFVIVWDSYHDGIHGGIFGQRFHSDGTPKGTEFRVDHNPGDPGRPSVASDASGNFVVVWQRAVNGSDIFGQRFDSAGLPRGGEFRVNTQTWYGQYWAAVSSDPSGNFVVVWQSENYYRNSHEGIFGQRFNSAGVKQGAEFRVNSYTTAIQLAASVATDASGSFVVVWDSFGQDGSGGGVFGQRYDSAGRARGGEFRVNSYTPGHQTFPFVASDASGGFVVAWESFAQDGGDWGIFARRYDSNGSPKGGEFRVNSYTTGQQVFPAVDRDAGGNFVVTWRSAGQDGSGRGIFGQRYDSGGVPQGSEFQVNSYTTGDQGYPAVSMTGPGQFVVAWDSYGQDGSEHGVFGQLYDFQTITVVSPNSNVRWRIGSVKEIRWTHNLGLGAAFRIDLDRDDDGDYEELIVANAPADTDTTGSFVWTVTGPPSATARVRVSWTDDLSVSDASDVTFRIKLEG